MYRQFYNCCILSKLSQKQQKLQKRKFLKICVLTVKKCRRLLKLPKLNYRIPFWAHVKSLFFFCSETVFLVFGTMQFCVPFVSELLLCKLSFLARQVRFKTSITRNTAHSCNGKVIDITRRICRNTNGIIELITNLTIEMKVTPL